MMKGNIEEMDIKPGALTQGQISPAKSLLWVVMIYMI